MAKTFTYDKRRHKRQPPQQRTIWCKPSATPKRGKYADIDDRVHEHRLDLLNRHKDQADGISERHKRPVND